MSAVQDLTSFWLSSPWLTWGLGPLLAFNLSFWLSVALLEWLISQPWATQYLLVYTANSSRSDNLQNTRTKFSWWTQAKGSMGVTFGPTSIINAVIGVFLLPWIITSDSSSSLPEVTVKSFLVSIVLLELVGDLFLYLGHRLQHEVPFLWKNFHSFHHQIDTPSPISTLYIDTTDATLQGGLPIIFAAIAHARILGPLHPFVFYLYIVFRIGENVVNHSGLNCWWLDMLTLKCLPGRASIAHHDSHHRFSSYGANAKNYGENFWIWDWAFGTLAKRNIYTSSTFNSKK